jgi:hypothetical protein
MSVRTLVISTAFLLLPVPTVRAQVGSPDPESPRPIDARLCTMTFLTRPSWHWWTFGWRSRRTL